MSAEKPASNQDGALKPSKTNSPASAQTINGKSKKPINRNRKIEPIIQRLKHPDVKKYPLQFERIESTTTPNN